MQKRAFAHKAEAEVRHAHLQPPKPEDLEGRAIKIVNPNLIRLIRQCLTRALSPYGDGEMGYHLPSKSGALYQAVSLIVKAGTQEKAAKIAHFLAHLASQTGIRLKLAAPAS